MVAIVAPAGARSIARMRGCLVPGRVADFVDEGAIRVRDLALPVLRAGRRQNGKPPRLQKIKYRRKRRNRGASELDPQSPRAGNEDLD